MIGAIGDATKKVLKEILIDTACTVSQGYASRETVGTAITQFVKVCDHYNLKDPNKFVVQYHMNPDVNDDVHNVIFSSVNRMRKNIHVYPNSSSIRMSDGRSTHTPDQYIVEKLRSSIHAAYPQIAMYAYGKDGESIYVYIVSINESLIVRVPSYHSIASDPLFEVEFTRMENNVVSNLSRDVSAQLQKKDELSYLEAGTLASYIDFSQQLTTDLHARRHLHARKDSPSDTANSNMQNSIIQLKYLTSDASKRLRGLSWSEVAKKKVSDAEVLSAFRSGARNNTQAHGYDLRLAKRLKDIRSLAYNHDVSGLEKYVQTIDNELNRAGGAPLVFRSALIILQCKAKYFIHHYRSEWDKINNLLNWVVGHVFVEDSPAHFDLFLEWKLVQWYCILDLCYIGVPSMNGYTDRLIALVDWWETVENRVMNDAIVSASEIRIVYAKSQKRLAFSRPSDRAIRLALSQLLKVHENEGVEVSLRVESYIESAIIESRIFFIFTESHFDNVYERVMRDILAGLKLARERQLRSLVLRANLVSHLFLTIHAKTSKNVEGITKAASKLKVSFVEFSNAGTPTHLGMTHNYSGVANDYSFDCVKSDEKFSSTANSYAKGAISDFEAAMKKFGNNLYIYNKISYINMILFKKKYATFKGNREKMREYTLEISKQCELLAEAGLQEYARLVYQNVKAL